MKLTVVDWDDELAARYLVAFAVAFLVVYTATKLILNPPRITFTLVLRRTGKDAPVAPTDTDTPKPTDQR